jgi:hypothetical protein
MMRNSTTNHDQSTAMRIPRTWKRVIEAAPGIGEMVSQR